MGTVLLVTAVLIFVGTAVLFALHRIGFGLMLLGIGLAVDTGLMAETFRQREGP